MQTFSSLSLVAKIEALFFSMYTYYSQSPKRHLEHIKLVEVIDSKGLNFLKNIKTRWISMLASFKQMLGEYKTLVVKMTNDVVSNAVVHTNYELLCGVKIVMGLRCVLPMLEAMQHLSKLTQNKEVFICDFVLVVKFCQFEIYTMYVNLEK